MVERLKRLAAEFKIAIAAGTIERSDQAYHVSCFIALPDGQLLVQRKHMLGPAELQAGFQTGPEERTFFEVDGVRMAVVICAETAIPDLRNKLAARGCQVMLLITAGGGGREHIFHPEDLQDPQRRTQYVKLMDAVCPVTSAVGDCVGHRMAQLAVNLSGDDGVDHYHPGHSSIIDSRGRIVALLPGEYVVDYLAPRLIHAPVVVQPPRTVAAADLREPQPPEKVLAVSRVEDFDVNGRGDAPAWTKVPWESLQFRGSGSHPYQTRVKLLYSATGLYALMEATDQVLTATLQEDFLDLWKEDVFEFFLWTDERQTVYFEYEISPLGSRTADSDTQPGRQVPRLAAVALRRAAEDPQGHVGRRRAEAIRGEGDRLESGGLRALRAARAVGQRAAPARYALAGEFLSPRLRRRTECELGLGPGRPQLP